MRRIALLPFLVIAVFVIAACNSAATSAPTTGGSVAPAGSAGGGGAGGVCATAEAGATAAVSVEIVDFAYSPEPVTAAVGDVIGWTNGDSAPHTATLDDGSCDTGNLSQGATGLLVFNEAGTFTYHCNVHPTQMKDFTIEITE
jgi:plastocyanin